MTESRPTTTIKNCDECSRQFETETGRYFESTTCPECVDRIQAEHEIAMEAKRLAEIEDKADRYFREVCPARYANTDPDHPTFNTKLWERLSTWVPSEEKPWLGIIGTTGQCKTRVAWLLARRITINAADNRLFSLMSLTDYELRDAALGRFGGDSESKEDALTTLHNAKRASLLIYDDIGKAKLTAAVAAEMFGIIDHRHAHNRSMIWTSNTMPAEFCKTIDQDIADPLKGRLLECSTIIKLK